MKIKAIIGSIFLLFIIILAKITFAATGIVEIDSNVTKVKKGETFTIIVSAISEDGINGIDTEYIYDAQKLE